MLERLMERARSAASMRVRERIAELAARIEGELPQGIEARAREDGLELEGRCLRRRFTLEPALRWLTQRLR